MSQPPFSKPKKTRRFLIPTIVLLLSAGAFYLWQKNENSLKNVPVIELRKFTAQRPLMGTLVALTVYAESSEQAQMAMSDAFQRGAEINQVASDYLPDSELTLFNTKQAHVWHDASDDFLTMIAYGLELAKLTNGAYDPTLGATTHLWRETKNAQTLPTTATLDQALAQTGWQHIEVDLEKTRIRKLKNGIRLDLGGLAKGYTADEMLITIQQRNLKSALIVVGGDVRCSDPPPTQEGWIIGLNDIRNDLAVTISVSNCAVSTSGDLQQFVEIDGRRYSHIIDPSTGLGLNDSLLATVIARNGLMADPLATAACIDPTFFNKLPPATKIHSRILSAEQEQISRGFPRFTPIITTDNPE